MTPERIVKVAEQYINQQEIPGNKGWYDKDFEAKMRQVGWEPTHSWCCYFTEMVAKEAFADQPDTVKALGRLFQASCTATYANFSGSSMFKVGKVPRPGSLMVWRLGQGWKGHIGIVTKVTDGLIDTIEGNTNLAGSREGTHVLRKKRKLAWTNGPGLNLVGFIYLC